VSTSEGTITIIAGGGAAGWRTGKEDARLATNDPNVHPLEAILTSCAEAGANPWYPSAFAQASGMPRDRLDAYLDELRLGGLLRLTDWVQGQGQGYALTPEGTEVVQNPRLMQKLRKNGVPRKPVPPALRPATQGEANTTTWDRGEAVRAAFLQQGQPVVTKVLIFLNIAVFLAGWGLAVLKGVPLNKFAAGYSDLASDPETFLQIRAIDMQIGALSRGSIYPDHEWWRLLTGCFVHIGLLHLALNMLSLYLIGPLLERMWGPVRFLVLYVIAGVGGSAAMVTFWNHPVSWGAGASGAIWGILASMLSWVLLNKNALPEQLTGAWLRRILLVFFFNIWFTFSVPGISRSGHFGGGLVGLVVAVPLNVVPFVHGWRRATALAGVGFVPLISLALMVHSFKWDRAYQDWRHGYFPRIQEQVAAAWKDYHLTQELLKQDPPRPRPKIMKAIVALEQGRHAWRRAEALVREAGPYSVAGFEEERTLYLQYIETSHAAFGAAQHVLRTDVKYAAAKELQKLLKRRFELEKQLVTVVMENIRGR
jgi:membrane associated rhomboid family serine protease